MISDITRFFNEDCKHNCSHLSDCLSFNQKHIKCITNKVITAVSYTIGIMSLMLQENKAKDYSSMLVSAIRQMQAIADWISFLQNNNGEILTHILEKDRRLCPRFNSKDISVIISGELCQLKNISLTGCHIETGHHYSMGTVMDIIIDIGTCIPARAVVKHSSKTGIGVEVTICDPQKEKEFLFFMADFFARSAFSAEETQNQNKEVLG